MAGLYGHSIQLFEELDAVPCSGDMLPSSPCSSSGSQGSPQIKTPQTRSPNTFQPTRGCIWVLQLMKAGPERVLSLTEGLGDACLYIYHHHGASKLLTSSSHPIHLVYF